MVCLTVTSSIPSFLLKLWRIGCLALSGVLQERTRRGQFPDGEQSRCSVCARCKKTAGKKKAHTVGTKVRESSCESGEGVRLPRERGRPLGKSGKLPGKSGELPGSLGNFRGTSASLLSFSQWENFRGCRRKASGEVRGTSGEARGSLTPSPTTRQIRLQQNYSGSGKMFSFQCLLAALSLVREGGESFKKGMRAGAAAQRWVSPAESESVAP